MLAYFLMEIDFNFANMHVFKKLYTMTVLILKREAQIREETFCVSTLWDPDNDRFGSGSRKPNNYRSDLIRIRTTALMPKLKFSSADFH